jgi:hypothetical protein
MASLALTLRHDQVLRALQQASAVAAEKAGNELCNLTIDQTGSVTTITNNAESRTGYPNSWTF